MLERGFEYFPSPENDGDEERIAVAFLYCSTAVEEWPRFRRELEQTGAKSAKQCDDLEKNAIDVFGEIRDAIFFAIESDNLALLPQATLLDRLVHANAFLALHADPASLLKYHGTILPQTDSLPQERRPQFGDFAQALWEANWNAPSDEMPGEITRRETFRHWMRHENDGLYNTSGRLDPVATAGELDPLFAATESIASLSTMQLAFIREKLRSIGRGVGLPKGHADFLARMALDGAKQEDNPAAWRAIRDRKRLPLLAKINELLASLR